MKKSRLVNYLLFIPLFGCAQQEPKPYGVLPSEGQLRWHEMETYCLIHYTPTTFQDKEWGFGDADPSIFNPTSFDANQIAKAAASAGFKGLISVAKHHDGFCLWPTATTGYNIKQSPWKNGEGDMVKEFMQASHDHGLKFGVYLSAWDRNDTRYGTPAYADAYRAQLTELMTNYGELFTSWHDGANGGDGYYGGKNEKRTIDRTTYYEWQERTWPIVREHQPLAVIFSDIGPDTRWVGNEHGFAAETSWATFTPKGIDGRPPVPGDSDYSKSPIGDRNGKYWIPAECDVPQRPGWFYHENQDDKVKTPDQLFEIYLKSVGRGGAMNLGLAPMPEGVLHPNDVKSLDGFGKKVAATFSTNLAKDAKIEASNIRGNSKKFSTAFILDEDRYSYYASDDEVINPTLVITLKNEQEFDIIRLRENIKLGQRLDSVRIDMWADGQWKHVGSATSIGASRLIKLDQPIQAQKIKLSLFAPVAPTLSDFGLFKEAASNFSFATKGNNLVKLRADEYGLEGTSEMKKAYDDDPNTFATLMQFSNGFVFTLREPIKGFSYLPRQDGNKEGIATKYNIAISEDNKNWKTLTDGEFSNVSANPVEQTVLFNNPVRTTYLRFIPKEIIGKSFTVAEFGLLKDE
ncbi:alpha-L-fucosidase [Sphingobacterium alkalisoli]|uniref:alpha-L-fucosidase n=1 Tax=Sphingobacterium alkalisoli TaxID=1874115 RepID=A0A4V5LXY4_9SPHI|nr:alpha-L-fucosidase [Sphingobacterium alkalisoli]TJY64419.1 alpha-L-fucosidase [Sphingobacterium alkalisoli]GGH21868.1 alpha-L-fucosidase [Sphingobacterium alkalisoli]